MPRKPVIPHEELIGAILNAEGVIDSNGFVSPPTHCVWNRISELLGGLVTPKYIRQYVWENRHSSFEKVRLHHGVPTPLLTPISDCISLKGSEDSFSESVGFDGIGSSSEDGVINRPSETFIINLSAEVWNEIKPIEKTYRRKDHPPFKRQYHVLPPRTWTDRITEALWDQHRIPCAYTFKRAKVYGDSFSRQEFINIKAYCKECGAKAVGKLIGEPEEGESVPIEWRAPNTKNKPHEKKRHLSGITREKVAKELRFQSSSVYRRQQADKLMDIFDPEPPHLFKGTTLRKAKQHFRNTELGIDDTTNPIAALAVMKHRHPFVGSIHDIGLDKAMVHYYTPAQLVVYKKYWQSGYCVLNIDATGTLVKRIIREHGPLGNIFLYEGVINTGDHQIPVIQMLSEKHDANSILYWLNEWERSGAPCPKEVVCDTSRALLSAITRSFGRSSDINDYKEKCFLVLTGRHTCLPPCFIRLDVAHFINNVCKLDIWRDKSWKRVKGFYVRCLALLIKVRSLSEFSDILKMILSVAMSETNGESADGCPTPAELNQIALIDRIGNHNLTENLVERSTFEQRLPDCDTLNKQNCDCISDWVSLIQSEAEKDSKTEGNRVSPYYSPKAAEEFCRLSHDFILWSAVMVPLFGSPHKTPSSASVEGDFADLKGRILKNETRPLPIHKFLAIHLKCIGGAMKIASVPRKDNTEHSKENISFQAEYNVNANIDKDIFNVDDSRANLSPVLEHQMPTGQNVNETNGHEHISDEVNSRDNSSPVSEQKIPTGQNFNDDFTAEQLNSDVTLRTSQENLKQTDLNFIENWRRKGLPPKKRQSKYLIPWPEIRAIQDAQRLKQPSKRLLLNGNKMPFVKIGDNFVQVKNTCAFDALCQSVVVAYIDDKKYRDFVNTFNNITLKTARELATAGAVTSTYNLRATALTEVVKSKDTISIPSKRCRAKSKTRPEVLVYECSDNAANLVEKLLPDCPSIIVTTSCSNKACLREFFFEKVILDVNYKVVLEHGIEALNEAILSGLRMDQTRCAPPCLGQVTNSFEPGHHRFLDVEFLGAKGLGSAIGVGDDNHRGYFLKELPLSLSLQGVVFNLKAVVAHLPNHYIAYTRRITGQWECFNDLAANVKCNINSSSVLVNPHVMLYIRE